MMYKICLDTSLKSDFRGEGKQKFLIWPKEARKIERREVAEQVRRN